MNGLLYDITSSYEDNWHKGPPLFQKHLLPKQRTIEKMQKFLGFEVNVPFGIPAGPILNAKYAKAAFDFGFDIVHYKTVRSVTVPANQFPNILILDLKGPLTLERARTPIVGKMESSTDPKTYSITNSFGNPSKDPAVWQEDMKKALSYQKKGQLLIASAVGTIQKGESEEDYFNDFAKTARLAKETGICAIELNLSCPNVANEGIICYTPQAVFAICNKTKEEIGDTPLIAKMGYFSENQQDLLEEIIKSITPFVSAVAAINTIPAPVVDESGKQALPGRNISGICGAGIKWAGIDMVKRLSALREKLSASYEVIGVGGVMTPQDYAEYRKVGADCVQSATGAMWNPYLAYEIWEKDH